MILSLKILNNNKCHSKSTRFFLLIALWVSVQRNMSFLHVCSVHTVNKILNVLKIWLKRLFKYPTFAFSIIIRLKYICVKRKTPWTGILCIPICIWRVSTMILYKLNYYTSEILKSFSKCVHRYVSINSSYDQSITSHNTRVSPTRQGLSFYCCYIILSLTSARQRRTHIFR